MALIDAVHGALQRAFRIPAEDRHVRLLAHRPHRFAVPPGTAQPDRFTIVSIDAFAGRSLEAKPGGLAATDVDLGFDVNV